MSTRCPRCFFPIDLDSRTAMECAGTCPEKPSPTASRFDGNQISQRRITTVQPPDGTPAEPRPHSLNCEGCNQPTDVEVCPICHYRLPDGWRLTVTTCIAMAGARASGKSFFISVMKRQVEQLFESRGMPMGYATAQTRNLYVQRYETPLYEERRLIPATGTARMDTPERAPMIFSLGRLHGRPHRLVVRDVAGEDLEAGDLDPWLFAFFAHADAILFLVDPLRVEEIRQMLVGLVPQEVRIGGDPKTVLGALMSRLEHVGSPRVEVPIGVVLSKFDVLQELEQVKGSAWHQIMRNRGAAFLRDPSMLDLAYDDGDGRLLHEETRSLLQRLGATSLVAQIEASFPTVRYFAVSALGQHSMGDEIHPRGISPFRTVDPVKWALARTGIIPTVSAANPSTP